MKIIKLIALFEGSEFVLQKYEDLVANATYEGITALTMLHNIYYRLVEPIHCICEECRKKFERWRAMEIEFIASQNQVDAKERIAELMELKYQGVTVGMDDLIVNLFREIYTNNRLTGDKIIFGKVRQNEQPREVHSNISIQDDGSV